MATHLSYKTTLPKNETIRIDSAAPGERDNAVNLSQQTEGTAADAAAILIGIITVKPMTSLDKLPNRPHMICQPGLHRRCDPECLMDTAEIEKGHVERDGGWG